MIFKIRNGTDRRITALNLKTVSRDRDGLDPKRGNGLLSNGVFLLYTVHLGSVQLQTCLALPVGMASRTADCIDNHLCNLAMATACQLATRTALVSKEKWCATLCSFYFWEAGEEGVDLLTCCFVISDDNTELKTGPP